MVGVFTGFSMGTYQGTVKTTIRPWEPDEKGFLKKSLTREHRIRAPHGVHSQSSYCFGRAGDSGAAILNKIGKFVRL